MSRSLQNIRCESVDWLEKSVAKVRELQRVLRRERYYRPEEQGTLSIGWCEGG